MADPVRLMPSSNVSIHRRNSDCVDLLFALITEEFPEQKLVIIKIKEYKELCDNLFVVVDIFVQT